MNPEAAPYEPPRGSNDSPKIVYHLSIVQQPEIGCELGPDRVILGRLPILPACIVEVIMEINGIRTPIINPTTLFCSCSIKTDTPPPIEEQEVENQVVVPQLLVGAIVKSLQIVKSLNAGRSNDQVGYFIFDDVGSRLGGRLRLEFILGEAKPDSPFLASTVSNHFNVVPVAQYPGRPASDFYTDLSRNLQSQGISIYIPAIVVP